MAAAWEVDIRKYPELLEQINKELAVHNTVELKPEVDRMTGQPRIVVLRVDRRIKAKADI